MKSNSTGNRWYVNMAFLGLTLSLALTRDRKGGDWQCRVTAVFSKVRFTWSSGYRRGVVEMVEVNGKK